MIPEIEEAVIEELRAKSLNKEVKKVTVHLCNRAAKVKLADLAKYYNCSVPSVSLLIKRKGNISEKGIKAIEKLTPKFQRVRINDKYFKPNELSKELKKKSVVDVAKKYNVSSGILHRIATNTRHSTRDNREYAMLKELGYNNATEYIREHGAMSYRKNIADKFKSLRK